MTKAMCKQHEAGKLELPWTNMSTKGVPTFRVITARGPTHFLSHHVPNSHVVDSNVLCVFDPRVHELSDHFACPKCNNSRDISNCSLLVKSGWGHILCLTCKLTSRSMTWKCACGVPWHTCNLHSARFRQSDQPMHEVPD